MHPAELNGRRNREGVCCPHILKKSLTRRSNNSAEGEIDQRLTILNTTAKPRVPEDDAVLVVHGSPAFRDRTNQKEIEVKINK